MLIFNKRKFVHFLSTAVRFASSEAKKLQIKALEEKCFLLSPTDQIIGTATKRECHAIRADGTLPLHRGFSVFLFNEKGHLLMQQRSAEKITYPNCHTNTCCSHPIADVGGEDEENDNLGIKRAARRRLYYELGIAPETIPLDKLKYITRVYYQDKGDAIWGEHEIDYVLLVKGNVPINPNPTEISSVKYIPRESIDEYVSTLQHLTPWFRLMYHSKLKQWWDNLDSLDNIIDHKSILTLS